MRFQVPIPILINGIREDMITTDDMSQGIKTFLQDFRQRPLMLYKDYELRLKPGWPF